MNPSVGPTTPWITDGCEEVGADFLGRPAEENHLVQFYDSENFLAQSVAEFLETGLEQGEPLVVIATPPHWRAFALCLTAKGRDVDAAVRTGQLTIRDAHATLSEFLLGDMPDGERFRSVVGDLFDRVSRRHPGTVRAYGEMVDLLWRAGNARAALRLEQLWNELSTSFRFSLLCAYDARNSFDDQAGGGAAAVCSAHTHVVTPESHTRLVAEIARREEVERALRQSLADLRRTADERQRLISELERTVRFSEMFVGILGHDLRNPLSAILTAAKHLHRRVEDEKLAKTAGRIVSSSERMGRMIDQLLDFTRVRLGSGIPLFPQATDIEEVCRLAVDELDGAGVAAVRLESLGDPVGAWDPDRLGQLASNLLGNAVHHGTPGEPIDVQIDGREPDRVTLSVCNAGEIGGNLLPVLFEPFRSVENRKEARSSGLGLGLYISQEIVLAHGGSIEVKSIEGPRTCFVVKIPRRTARRAEHPGRLSAGGDEVAPSDSRRR